MDSFNDRVFQLQLWKLVGIYLLLVILAAILPAALDLVASFVTAALSGLWLLIAWLLMLKIIADFD